MSRKIAERLSPHVKKEISKAFVGGPLSLFARAARETLADLETEIGKAFIKSASGDPGAAKVLREEARHVAFLIETLDSIHKADTSTATEGSGEERE